MFTERQTAIQTQKGAGDGRMLPETEDKENEDVVLLSRHTLISPTSQTTVDHAAASTWEAWAKLGFHCVKLKSVLGIRSGKQDTRSPTRYLEG